MEGRVKSCDLGNFRQQLLHGINTLKIGWIMQGRKVNAGLNTLNNFLGN